MLYAKRRYKIGLVSLKKGDNCPPIGLVNLGSYLKKNGVEAEILDANYGNIMERLPDGFDLIGISAMSPHYAEAIRVAKRIKKQVDIPVILGGVHITTLPESLDSCFDGAILGEGEKVLLEIAEGRKPSGIMKGELIQDIDTLPQPDWSLADNRYFSHTPSTTFGEFGIEGNVLTSRGCPYKCLFCSTTKFWDKLRFHSPEYVVDMIENLITYKQANLIQIWDDLFTINLPRLVKIKDLLRKRKLIKNVKFNCQPRPNLVNDELCGLLEEMNVTMGMFGFESGSDKVLGYLKNNTVTVAENMKSIECFRRHNLEVQGSVVLGSPNETLEDMYKTLDFVNFCIKQAVQRLWVFILTPYPGTEMWKLAKLKKVNWDTLQDEPLLLNPEVSKDDFFKVFDKISQRIRLMRWNKVKSFAFNNPFQSLVHLFSKPKQIYQLLTTKNDV